MRKSSSPSDKVCEMLLFDYATGNLCEASRLMAATFLALNPSYRPMVRDFENIGGSLLNKINPAEVSQSCLDNVLQRIEGTPCDKEAPIKACPPQSTIPHPHPLKQLCHASCFDELAWKQVVRGLEKYALALQSPIAKVKLVRCQPGFSAPHHAHKGSELTIVLKGAFEDEFGEYHAGEAVIFDEGEDVTHTPHACDKEGCITLVMTTAPIKPTNPLYRLLTRLYGF